MGSNTFTSSDDSPEELALFRQRSLFKSLHVMLAMFTGVRAGEMANLDWRSVDFRTGTMTIRKRARHKRARR